MTLTLLLGSLAALAIAGLWAFSRSWYSIEEGHLATLSDFGRAQQFENGHQRLLKMQGPGLHMKWPWQRVHAISLMERCLDLSGESGGCSVMTDDGTVLRLDSKLRYAVNPQQAYAFAFELKEPEEHIKGLFTCLLRNEIANFDSGKNGGIGSYDRLRRNLPRLNREIENICKNEIPGRYGVNFGGVDITDILPPDELAQALNSVIAAQLGEETRHSKATAECEQRVLSAERGVEISRQQAAAVEKGIRESAKYLKELSHKRTLQRYVQRRRAEIYAQSRAVFVRRPS